MTNQNSVVRVWKPVAESQVIGVSPPPSFTPSFAHHAKDKIEATGENIAYIPSIAAQDSDKYWIWQGTPTQRANAIMDILRQPNISAIIASGGAGTQEVIHILQTEHAEELQEVTASIIRGERKASPMFGLSDATHLLQYLGGLGVISPVLLDASSIYTDQYGEEGMDALREIQRFLKTGSTQDVKLRPVNHAAETMRELSGGMTVYNVHAWHVPSGLMTGGKWSNFLLLETGHFGEGIEDGKGLQRNLRRLKQSGKLTGIDAIILSRCDADGSTRKNIDEIDISTLRLIATEELNDTIPIYLGAPYGHPPKQEPFMYPHALPLMTHAAITTDDKGTTLKMDGIRTLESVQDVSGQFVRQLKSPIPFQRDAHPGRETVKVLPFPYKATEYLQNASSPPSRYLACKVQFDDILGGGLLPALRGENTKGKHLLVIYDPPSNVDSGWANVLNDMHISFAELLQRGQLQKAESLTIASTMPFHESMTQWLKDYAVQHLPNTPVSTLQISSKIAEEIPNNCPINLTVVRKQGKYEQSSKGPSSVK